MESLSRQPDLERLLYQSSKPGGLETVQQQSATAATVLTLEGKADAPAASSEREEVQIKLVDKLQMVRSPVEAAAAVGSELDATSQLAAAEEAGAGALDIAQRRALLLGRTKQRHVCLQCGRECPSKHKLKRHLSTHSEQRPYNCHLCGKTFKWTEYLAKHMRTQHPGAEVPAFATTHGPSSSPAAHSCLSPPPTTATASSPTTTPSHPPQLVQPQSRLDTLTNSANSSSSASMAPDTLSASQASLGSEAVTDSPIGCDDTVYEGNSHLGGSLAASLQPHTVLLSRHNFQEHSPLSADELLQPPSSVSHSLSGPQTGSSANQHSSQLNPSPLPPSQQLLQQQQQPPVVREPPDLLQQFQKQQQQQEFQSEKQKLLQQQIQRHQLQQLQQSATQQLSQQVLPHHHHQGQMGQQVVVQPAQPPQQVQGHRLQQSLVQSTQDLLQTTTSTELQQSPHSLSGGQLLTTEQQFVSSSGSPQGQPVVGTADSPAQLATGGGGVTFQVGHPLAHHMMTPDTTVVQGMGYVDQATESYDPSSSSSGGVVYTTDGMTYQDSSNSQVFTSPVYSSQDESQVYQMSTQPPASSLAPQENFSEPLSVTDSSSYSSALTGLPLPQGQQPSNQQSLDPGSFSLSQQRQQQQSMGGPQDRGGEGAGSGGMMMMDGMNVQSQDANILHMQAQIAQSAYELQSVQVDASMQGYDTSGMMQTPASFPDGTAAGYQETTTAYQDGTNAYQTGANAYQIQPGGGVYQEGGVSYQEQPHTQTSSTSYTSEIESSQQMYNPAQVGSTQGQGNRQQLYDTTGMVGQDVVSYGQQISISENVYGTLTSDSFQQTSIPAAAEDRGLSNAAPLQPQVSTLERAALLLNTQPTQDVLNAVHEVEAAISLHQEAQPTSVSTTIPTETTSGKVAVEKSTKKSSRPKESVGIQCEVGPETFRALKEEEAANAKVASSSVTSNRRPRSLDSGASSSNETASSVPQKVPTSSSSSSLLLANPGSPPVHDSIVSSPGLSLSGGDPVSFANQSDKIIRKYPCELNTCGKAYVHRKDLIRHMSLRHGMSPQKLEPVVIETPEKPYTCQVGVCRRSYFHQKDLRRHQRQCHLVNDTGSIAGGVEMTDIDGKVMVRFPCDFPGCQRSYVHKKDLVRHKRVYHKDESKKPSIPVPVKFTEADLKRIRHEEKSFQENEGTSVKKARLDSTGSAMSSGEDQSQGPEAPAVAGPVVSLPEVAGGVVQLSTSPGLTSSGDAGDIGGVMLDRGQDLPSLQPGTELQDIPQAEQAQLNEVQLALGLSQQGVGSATPTEMGGAPQQAQNSPPQQSTHHLPTILRRQRQPSSNGHVVSASTSTPSIAQDHQQLSELALRNLASLMLGGLQGNVTSGSGSSFDHTPTVPAFSASALTTVDDPVTSQPTLMDTQQTVAQFDPAAIISALSSVVNNNPDVLTSSASVDQQHQVVSVENVASALQYLTSTSSHT